MTKSILFACLSFVLLVTIFSACNKKTTPITSNELAIKVLNTNINVDTADVCGVMHQNVLKLKTGTSLNIKFHFTGAKPLSQYKIDIHSNFDCHAHQRPLQIWQYLVVQDFNTITSDTVLTETIPIPNEAASGNYHCIIRLIDEEGNEAEFVEYNLILHNAEDDIAPTINLTQPNSDSITMAKGDQLLFQGSIEDNYSLKNGKLTITYAKKDGIAYTAINEAFSDTTHLTHALNKSYTIPNYIDTGLYIFTLNAYDEWNNNGTKMIKVYIHN